MTKFFATVAAVGLLATAGTVAMSRDLDASVSTRSKVHSSTTGAAVHMDRGPNHRPYGWSQGKKKGWDCTPGRPGCKPPGQR
jgi:hypothetical protein